MFTWTFTSRNIMGLGDWCKTLSSPVKGADSSQHLHLSLLLPALKLEIFEQKKILKWRNARWGPKLTITAGKNLIKWNSASAPVDVSGFKFLRQRVIFKQNFNLHIHELFLVTGSKIAIWACAMCSHRAAAWPGSLGTRKFLHTPGPPTLPWVWHCGLGTRSVCPLSLPGHGSIVNSQSLGSRHLTEVRAVVWSHWRPKAECCPLGAGELCDSEVQLSQPLWLLLWWEWLRLRVGIGLQFTTQVMVLRLLICFTGRKDFVLLWEEEGGYGVGKAVPKFSIMRALLEKVIQEKTHLKHKEMALSLLEPPRSPWRNPWCIQHLQVAGHVR